MSVISKVKQNIRDYLTTKYDAQYFQELENQTNLYDDWVWEQNNSDKEVCEELMLDLGKKENEKRKKRELVTKISYSKLNSSEALSDLDISLSGNISDEKLAQEAQISKGTFVKDLMDREIVILAEETDRVTPDAVTKIVEAFENHPQIEVVYTDEDEVNHEETVRMNPWFKPDYSPDTLLSYFYFGKMVAVRKSILADAIKRVLSNRECDFEREETVLEEVKITADKKPGLEYRKYIYAIILEVCLNLDRNRIHHLKKVLYSSHNITSWGFEEEYKQIRQSYDNLREREEAKGVSIIIPSKDNPQVLGRCLESIEKWTIDTSYEIIVVDNGSNEENKTQLEAMQKQYGFHYIYEPLEFNFSNMCNQGAKVAKYELLLFLNDDCEVRGSKWLSHMANLAKVKTTGAVGAKLYYPNSKKIQHCGIYNIHVGPVHKLQFKEDIRVLYDRRNLDVRNVLAVTAACLMVRKSVFEKIGGFDTDLQVAFNDVDFCYKLYEAGYNNVVDNEIHLWHHESLSRGSDESPDKLKRLMQEKEKLYQKHSLLWEADHYYHEGFTKDILDTNYSFDFEYPHHKHLAVEIPKAIGCLPKGIREDQCVAPMVEYAGDLKGWFLEEELISKIEGVMGTRSAAYLQGNVVVLGSDNACFEKKILLRHEADGAFYEISPEWYYRPDVFCNLQDQKNVALSGFACLVNMEAMPPGRYEVGLIVTDKISKQSLLRVTTRSIERIKMDNERKSL